MVKNELVCPVVKWVGGKRQLLDEIGALLPKKISNYCEPFLGGGAVLFSIQPKKAIVNDINADLMTVYRVIQEKPDELINSLIRHENTPEYFYKIREMDRNEQAYQSLSDVERASRLIYLNKSCFNGLFRVNSSGEFNAPFGYYRNPNIVNEPVLRAVHHFFQTVEISFYNEDYSNTLKRLSKGSFVYLDPPYDPISDTANFTGYNKGGFGREEQIRLRECCDELTRQGINFMLSNSATEFIKEQYKHYNIKIVQAKRNINSNTSRRGTVEEVIVRNYE